MHIDHLAFHMWRQELSAHSVSRSLDNQVYTAAIATARDEKVWYISWGHSILVNPWPIMLHDF